MNIPLAYSHKFGDKDFPPLPEPLPVPIFDTHTHFDIGIKSENLKAALDTAQQVGVIGAVQVGCDISSSRFTAKSVEKDSRLLGAIAIHPNEVPQLAARGELDAAFIELEELAKGKRIRAIGETGLDYYRTGIEGIAVQKEAFRRSIDLAKRKNLVLQIHDRDAHDDVIDILLEEGAPEYTIFHCFSGDKSIAKRCAEQGWYLSFSGTVTFKNAQYLRDALLCVSSDLILVETDAPFLTPHPYRGYANASYMLPETVKCVATTLDKDLGELCELLSANTRRVFGSW